MSMLEARCPHRALLKRRVTFAVLCNGFGCAVPGRKFLNYLVAVSKISVPCRTAGGNPEPQRAHFG